MSPIDVLTYTSSHQFLGKRVLKDTLNKENTLVSKRFRSCAVSRQLTPLQSVALLLCREYTERDAIFIRRFLGGLPSVRDLRKARWSLLTSRPQIFTLLFGETELKLQPSGRFLIGAQQGREVQCARLSLPQTLLYYLQSALLR